MSDDSIYTDWSVEALIEFFEEHAEEYAAENPSFRASEVAEAVAAHEAIPERALDIIEYFEKRNELAARHLDNYRTEHRLTHQESDGRAALVALARASVQVHVYGILTDLRSETVNSSNARGAQA